MNKVRFGIIGIGKMGSQHCLRFTHGLIKNGTLTAVCDISPDRKKWAEEKLAPKGVEFFDDYKSLIDSGKVDAVLIATPHYLHPVIAIYALEKGLHTLIEKPAGVFANAFLVVNMERRGIYFRYLFDLVECDEGFFHRSVNSVYINILSIIILYARSIVNLNGANCSRASRAPVSAPFGALFTGLRTQFYNISGENYCIRAYIVVI